MVITMKTCWSRFYQKIVKWRHYHPSHLQKRTNGRENPFMPYNAFQGQKQQYQQRRPMYSCVVPSSSTPPPMTMSTMSDFSTHHDEDDYDYNTNNDDTHGYEEGEHHHDGGRETPALSSSSNLSSSACYSNFYLKLNNGKYMVRVRTAERVIIGSYIIDEHMI